MQGHVPVLCPHVYVHLRTHHSRVCHAGFSLGAGSRQQDLMWYVRGGELYMIHAGSHFLKLFFLAFACRQRYPITNAVPLVAIEGLYSQF